MKFLGLIIASALSMIAPVDVFYNPPFVGQVVHYRTADIRVPTDYAAIVTFLDDPKTVNLVTFKQTGEQEIRFNVPYDPRPEPAVGTWHYICKGDKE